MLLFAIDFSSFLNEILTQKNISIFDFISIDHSERSEKGENRYNLNVDNVKKTFHNFS